MDINSAVEIQNRLESIALKNTKFDAAVSRMYAFILDEEI